jgi:hypothetical protein
MIEMKVKGKTLTRCQPGTQPQRDSLHEQQQVHKSIGLNNSKLDEEMEVALFDPLNGWKIVRKTML